MIWSELELRWVLLGLGLLVILGVFVGGWFKSRSRPSGTSRPEPELWPEELESRPEDLELQPGDPELRLGDPELQPGDSELRLGGPEAVVSATRLARSRNGLAATAEVEGASTGAAEDDYPSPETSGEPSVGLQDGSAAGDVADAERVVSLRLVAREGGHLDAERTVRALREAGLQHGPYDIFHYCEDRDAPQSGFSVANLVEPGSFDLSSPAGATLPGMTFFLVLPGSRDPVERFDRMVGTARELCQELDADLLDESGNSWTIQGERYIREELIDYCRRHSGR